MDVNQGVSSKARLLIYVTAAAFGLMGLLLFILPTWSAANFSWKISSIVAMTMGGWYLGTAVMAGLVAFHRRWNVIYCSGLYLIIFSLSEALVLVIHSTKLKLDALLAWPYIGMLALAILAGIFALLDWARQKPVMTEEGSPVTAWMRVVIVVFILFVFLLSGVAFSGYWVGLNGVIFPEPLSLFTLHSFGAFYFSLAFSVLTLLRVRRLAAVTVEVWGGLALISFITAAALLNLRVFNFSEHPFQLIYLGVYIIALVLALFFLWYERVQRKDSSAA